MSQPDFRDGEPEEAPLDPATQRVQAKLKRLLLGSSLIMFAGFVAVFAAIFYKINSNGDGAAADAFAETIELGPATDVLQVSEADGILFVLVQEDEGKAFLRFEAATGKLLGRTEFLNK